MSVNLIDAAIVARERHMPPASGPEHMYMRMRADHNMVFLSLAKAWRKYSYLFLVVTSGFGRAWIRNYQQYPG